jgi:ribosome-associated toxin RatA of RatAB toxin-antitoxin module
VNRIERSAIVPYSAEALYAIVEDIESYPSFLPWCLEAEVLERVQDGDKHTRARLTVGYKGIRQSFTTDNLNKPGESIDMQLVEGPFARFAAGWRFHRLEAEGCRIAFFMECEFSSKLLAKTLDPLFERIADTMVDAFVKRAEAQHEKDPG